MKTTLGLFLLAVVCATGAYAQSEPGYGAVTGTVRDANGEGIPDSSVFLSNESMGIRRSMMSTDDGTFDAPSLTPAKGYSLKVTRKGFVDWKSTVFDVSTGQTLNFTVMMQAEGGSVPEVDPARALAPVDDTRVGVSTLVGRSQIDGLPTIDRRLDELVLMAPTVSTDSAHGVIAFQGSPFLNSFLVDGISTANTYYVMQRPGIANQISQDAVDEVQVLVGDASSEFGRFLGGTVNTVTRSGGNSFHGAGYGYLAKPTLSSAERYAMGRESVPKAGPGGREPGRSGLPRQAFLLLACRSPGWQFPGHEPHHQPDDRQFHGHLRSILELQDLGDRVRGRNPVHPGANERGVAALPGVWPPAWRRSITAAATATPSASKLTP